MTQCRGGFACAADVLLTSSCLCRKSAELKTPSVFTHFVPGLCLWQNRVVGVSNSQLRRSISSHAEVDKFASSTAWRCFMSSPARVKLSYITRRNNFLNVRHA